MGVQVGLEHTHASPMCSGLQVHPVLFPGSLGAPRQLRTWEERRLSREPELHPSQCLDIDHKSEATASSWGRQRVSFSNWWKRKHLYWICKIFTNREPGEQSKTPAGLRVLHVFPPVWTVGSWARQRVHPGTQGPTGRTLLPLDSVPHHLFRARSHELNKEERITHLSDPKLSAGWAVGRTQLFILWKLAFRKPWEGINMETWWDLFLLLITAWGTDRVAFKKYARDSICRCALQKVLFTPLR